MSVKRSQQQKNYVCLLLDVVILITAGTASDESFSSKWWHSVSLLTSQLKTVHNAVSHVSINNNNDIKISISDVDQTSAINCRSGRKYYDQGDFVSIQHKSNHLKKCLSNVSSSSRTMCVDDIGLISIILRLIPVRGSSFYHCCSTTKMLKTSWALIPHTSLIKHVGRYQ